MICRAKEVNSSVNNNNNNSNSVLTPLNSNYSFNVLASKNSNYTQSTQFSTSSSSSNSSSTANTTGLLNTEPSLNCNSASLLFYNPKTPRNFYNHFDPGVTYLPNNDLFLPPNANDQFTYLSGPNLSELTTFPTIVSSLQPQQQQTKPLTFTTKSPFTLQNGIKKRKKRFKKPPELRKVLPKNSLMVLHELRPNVEYRFLCQNGPIHRPTFKMCVEIEEHRFEGTGRTKKEARMMAAEKAVEFLLQHPEFIQKSKNQTSGEEKRMNDSENEENNTNNNIEAKLEDTSSSSNDEASDSDEISQKKLKP